VAASVHHPRQILGPVKTLPRGINVSTSLLPPPLPPHPRDDKNFTKAK